VIAFSTVTDNATIEGVVVMDLLVDTAGMAVKGVSGEFLYTDAYRKQYPNP
jgi:hypothetical protein